MGREELRPLNYPSPGLLSTAAVSRGWGGGGEATNVSEPRLPHAQPGSRAEFLASPAPRHAVLSYISAFPFLSLLFKMLRFSSLKIVFASNSITF